MGFSQISLSDPNDGSRKDFPRNFFQDLHVPLIQTHTMFRSYETWDKDIQDLSTTEISSNIVWPEFDGQIISIPLGSSEKAETGTTITVPIPGRPERVADMALQLSRLRRTPVSERKIAILIYQYTGDTDTLGHAAGLDVPASVIETLRYMIRQMACCLIWLIIHARLSSGKWQKPVIHMTRQKISLHQNFQTSPRKYFHVFFSSVTP